LTAKTQQSSLNIINIFANKFFEHIWKENKMLINVFEGILIPFVGTTLGATCVFCMKKTLSKSVQRALAGFAAGIMVAASIWSLLIPAIKQSENAGFLSENVQITATSALALSLGIAIQNFPEGAIISMPLRAEGESKRKAFLGGVLSGVVEPIGAVLTILAAQLVIPALPYLLSFAAGAMLYVVVEELIPEMSQGQNSNIGTLFFSLGFSLMMILDVALG